MFSQGTSGDSLSSFLQNEGISFGVSNVPSSCSFLVFLSCCFIFMHFAWNLQKQSSKTSKTLPGPLRNPPWEPSETFWEALGAPWEALGMPWRTFLENQGETELFP